MMQASIRVLSVTLLLILVLAQASVWEVAQERLASGDNLLYAVFGEPSAVKSGLQLLLIDLGMAHSAVFCIDAHTTPSLQTIENIRQINDHDQQSGNGDGLLIVVNNVEKLNTNSELLHLDFLFRLPDKNNHDMGSMVVALVWNTANMNTNSSTEASATVQDDNTDTDTDTGAGAGVDFWNRSPADARLVWREEVRSLWGATEQSFNADAILGRVSSPLFYPTTTTTTEKAEKEKESQPSVSVNDMCMPLASILVRRSNTAANDADSPASAAASCFSNTAAWKSSLLNINRSTALRLSCIATVLFIFVLFFRQAMVNMNSPNPEQESYTVHVRETRKSKRLAAKKKEKKNT